MLHYWSVIQTIGSRWMALFDSTRINAEPARLPYGTHFPEGYAAEGKGTATRDRYWSGGVAMNSFNLALKAA